MVTLTEPGGGHLRHLRQKADVQMVKDITLENIAQPMSRPEFEQLPLKSHHPPYSAWGLWGDDDQAGTVVRSLHEYSSSPMGGSCCP